MTAVVVDPQTEGLGVMLAELVRANLSAHPKRAKHLARAGTVNILATDADVEVGLRLGDGEFRVGPAHAVADLSVATSSELLLSLSNVPLRFGLPDSFTAEGRRVTGKLMKGEIQLHGVPRHLKLLTRLNHLLSVRA